MERTSRNAGNPEAQVEANAEGVWACPACGCLSRNRHAACSYCGQRVRYAGSAANAPLPSAAPMGDSPYASPWTDARGPVQYRDRSGALVAMGIVQILLGLALLAMLAFMAVPMQRRPYPGGTQAMLPAMLFFVLGAVLFFVLGVGSIGARRWARALSLVLSWFWLLGGIVAMVATLVALGSVFRQMPQRGASPEAAIIGVAIGGGCLGLVYVVLPLVFVLFYGSPHVKATCERRNPQPSWTDRCPLPVLALSLLLGLGAGTTLLVAAANPVLPFFGQYLKGISAVPVYLGMGLAMAYLAWADYRLKMHAWWATFALYLATGVSNVTTFAVRGVDAYYEQMDFPRESVAALRQGGMLADLGALVSWPAIISTVVFLGYLLYVRKFFVRKSSGGVP